jgi:phage baseplate assembly protein W
MTTITDNLKTQNWQMSSTDPGQVVTQEDDINQCLLNIINTQKGSDPINPLFGVDIISGVDKPINERAAALVKGCSDAIATWENRIVVNKITCEINVEQIIITVNWSWNSLTGQISNGYATS